MVRIKNWIKSKAYNKKVYTIYLNTLPKYMKFNNAFYLSIGNIGNTTAFYVSIAKQRKQVAVKEFKKHKPALKFAMDYMKKHSEG